MQTDHVRSRIVSELCQKGVSSVFLGVNAVATRLKAVTTGSAMYVRRIRSETEFQSSNYVKPVEKGD